jgi:hypothetical protein
VVVVGGGGGGGGAVVVVVAGGAVVVVVAGGAVVVVVAGAVVDVVVGPWYAARPDDRFTPLRREDACAAVDVCSCALPVAASDRDACADALLCNRRRGAPTNAPQRAAATPRRLPPVLWFRRAPPFFGDTVRTRADVRVAGGFW